MRTQHSLRKRTIVSSFNPQWAEVKGQFVHINPLRPGKTAEDKRIRAWKPKHTIER